MWFLLEFPETHTKNRLNWKSMLRSWNWIEIFYISKQQKNNPICNWYAVICIQIMELSVPFLSLSPIIAPAPVRPVTDRWKFPCLQSYSFHFLCPFCFVSLNSRVGKALSMKPLVLLLCAHFIVLFCLPPAPRQVLLATFFNLTPVHTRRSIFTCCKLSPRRNKLKVNIINTQACEILSKSNGTTNCN